MCGLRSRICRQQSELSKKAGKSESATLQCSGAPGRRFCEPRSAGCTAQPAVQPALQSSQLRKTHAHRVESRSGSQKMRSPLPLNPPQPPSTAGPPLPSSRIARPETRLNSELPESRTRPDGARGAIAEAPDPRRDELSAPANEDFIQRTRRHFL